MTELRDRYGLLISTAGAAAAHYRTGLDRLLSYDGGAEASLLAALDADPEFALAHARTGWWGSPPAKPERGGGEPRKGRS